MKTAWRDWESQTEQAAERPDGNEWLQPHLLF